MDAERTIEALRMLEGQYVCVGIGTMTGGVIVDAAGECSKPGPMGPDETRAAIGSLSGRRLRAMEIGPDEHRHGGMRVRFPQDEVLEVPLAGATGEWIVEGAALLVTRGDCRTLLFDGEQRAARDVVGEMLVSEMGVERADRFLARSSRRPRSRKGGGRRCRR